MFKGLTFNSVTLATNILDTHTYWQKANTRIKCLRTAIMDNNFMIKNQPISDLRVGQNYTFEIIQTNVLSYRWDLMNEGGIKTTKVVTYTPKTMGRKVICVNVTVFGGAIKSRCIEFYVQPSDGNPNTGGAIQSSKEEEIFAGKSYGKLMKFGNLLWLQNDVEVHRSSTALISNCPAGFELPTQNVYDAMISSLGADAYYTLTRQANYSLSYDYIYENENSKSIL